MGILPPQQPLIGITDFLIQAPSITESGIYLALKKAGKYIAFLFRSHCISLLSYNPLPDFLQLHFHTLLQTSSIDSYNKRSISQNRKP